MVDRSERRADFILAIEHPPADRVGRQVFDPRGVRRRLAPAAPVRIAVRAFKLSGRLRQTTEDAARCRHGAPVVRERDRDAEREIPGLCDDRVRHGLLLGARSSATSACSLPIWSAMTASRVPACGVSMFLSSTAARSALCSSHIRRRVAWPCRIPCRQRCRSFRARPGRRWFARSADRSGSRPCSHGRWRREAG